MTLKYQLINKKDLSTLIESNNLAEKYFIFKKYPSSLNINIYKTSFLARISKNGKIYDLGSNGKLIENKYSNNQYHIFISYHVHRV